MDALSLVVVALSLAAFQWVSVPAGYALFAFDAAVSAGRARSNRRLAVAWAIAAVLLVGDAIVAAVASSFWATLPLVAVTLTIVLALLIDIPSLRVPRPELRRFYIWWSVTTAVVVAGAIVGIVQARRHRLDDAPADTWPSSSWVLVFCIVALAVSLAGGFLVFRRRPSWVAVVMWPLCASLAISACGFAVPYLMGETGHMGVVGSCIRDGRRLCGQFGVVQPYFLIASPIVLPIAFVAGHLIRRCARGQSNLGTR